MLLETPYDRASAVAWAQAVLGVAETVFLDTETTGLGPDAEIVDVAVLAPNGAVLLDSLVRPVRSIPPAASLVHGISDDDVRTAPSWQEVVALLTPALTDRLIVVYNADFDRVMIGQCYVRCGIRAPKATWVCAMKSYAAFRGQRMRGRPGFKWHNLATAAAAFGLSPGEHRARSDAEACRGVVVAMSQANVR
jgi:DNA polymerase-3 subunit epsilon